MVQHRAINTVVLFKTNIVKTDLSVYVCVCGGERQQHKQDTTRNKQHEENCLTTRQKLKGTTTKNIQHTTPNKHKQLMTKTTTRVGCTRHILLFLKFVVGASKGLASCRRVLTARFCDLTPTRPRWLKAHERLWANPHMEVVVLLQEWVGTLG